MVNRTGNRKGQPMTPAQKAALDAGRVKGQAVTRKRAEKARERRRTNPNAKSRNQMLMEGEITVEDLDDEELQHFRGRDKDGEFKGRVPPLPPKIREAIRQKLLQQMQTIVEGFAPRAAAVLESIAEGGEHEPSRVKAAELLLQRSAGKVPDKVLIGSADPWADALEEFLGGADDESAAKARERLGKMTQGAEAVDE
jgi:hypothetical protein